MKTIWKVELKPGIGYQEIELPSGSKPLHVGFQGLTLCIWFQVDDTQPRFPVELFIAGTGIHMPDEVFYYWKHVGTALSDNVRFVWHVYMRGI